MSFAGSISLLGLSLLGTVSSETPVLPNACVTLYDATPPEIHLVAPWNCVVEVGTAYEDPGATAWDDLGGDLSPDIVVSGYVNAFRIGIYYQVYDVCDPCGNCDQVLRPVYVAEPGAKLPAIGPKGLLLLMLLAIAAAWTRLRKSRPS